MPEDGKPDEKVQVEAPASGETQQPESQGQGVIQ